MAKASKTKPQAPDSPVTHLLRTVWANAQKATEHSWQRLNSSMCAALELAIGSGMTFTADDFKHLSEFRSGYWIGDDDEWVYSMAIAEGNYSAATAWEEYKEREPLIADEVLPSGQCHRHRILSR